MHPLHIIAIVFGSLFCLALLIILAASSAISSKSEIDND
jgi:hypothetical protein